MKQPQFVFHKIHIFTVVESFVIVHTVIQTLNSHQNIINESDAHGKCSFVLPSWTHSLSLDYVSSFVMTRLMYKITKKQSLFNVVQDKLQWNPTYVHALSCFIYVMKLHNRYLEVGVDGWLAKICSLSIKHA